MYRVFIGEWKDFLALAAESNAAPAIAPVAAAVTPPTKAFTLGFWAARRKYVAGMITNR